MQNVPNLWSTTIKCQKVFYDGIEPKIGFEEYGCVTENWNIFAMANQSSYILYLSADEDKLSKIELHLGLSFYANKM